MKKLSHLFFAASILVLTSVSTAHAQGFSPLQGVFQTQGEACAPAGFANATVTVYSLDSDGNRITKTLPRLYTNSTLEEERSNPFNAAPTSPFGGYPEGFWGFWIANGRYEIVATDNEMIAPFSISVFMQAPATGGATNGFINVKDAPYSAAGNGITDDTWAIKKAVNDLGVAGGGVLYFPNGTYRVGTNLHTGGEQQLPIVLPSGVTIQGTSGAYFSSSKIYLPDVKEAFNKTVFKMDQCTRQVTIRELEIQSATLNGTTGILATGKYPNSSYRLSLSHLTVRGFNVGFDVQAHPHNGYGWQLGSSEIDFVNFNENTTSIHVDAANAELQISNTTLSAGPNSSALVIDNGGIFQIHDVFGWGSNADTFIWLRGRHGYIDASTIECEGFKNTLVNDFSSTLEDQYLFPIRISNSILGSKILLRENCIYVSSGNTYYATTVETVNNGTTVLPRRPDGSAYPGYVGNSDPEPPRPACDPLPTGGHADKVLIYSTGDYFYPLIGGSTCAFPFIALDPGASGDFLLTGDSKLAFRAGQNSADFHLPVNIGVPGFNYNFKRNGITGFLDILGTQAPPFRGFNFNGPVQLHQATWSEISSWGTINLGGLIYCKDCIADTNGSCVYSDSPTRGEVARYTGSGWKCN